MEMDSKRDVENDNPDEYGTPVWTMRWHSADLAWAKADGETLIVITADHETGGFAINKGSTRDSINAAFTSDYHTATMVPVFAFGPGAEKFRGIYPNTAIYTKMRQAFGWQDK